jgi:inner membrane protein
MLRCWRPGNAEQTIVGMAGFGHVAVGLASGRLISTNAAQRGRVLRNMGAAILLAMLPDFDLIPLAFGLPDRGLFGHRGLLHTPLFALAVGAAVFAGSRLWRRQPLRDALRTALIACLLVASHGVLDALAQQGRGVLFLWPLSSARFHFLWRPIPDAPTGLAFFSGLGMRHLAIELCYFFPLLVYASSRTRTQVRPPVLAWMRLGASPSGSSGAASRPSR